MNKTLRLGVYPYQLYSSPNEVGGELNSLLKDDDGKAVSRRLDRSTEEEVDVLVTSQSRRTEWETEVDNTVSEPRSQDH